MKKILLISTVIVLIVAGVLAAKTYKHMEGVGPAILEPPADIVEEIERPGANNTPFPLQLPDGFALTVFAKNLPGARSIVQDGFGNFWVSRPGSGIVTQLIAGSGGKLQANDILRGLRNPHGLAIDPGQGFTLYVAEEHQIVRVHLYSDAPIETVAELPTGGRHTTRTMAFGPDGRLYVSIGSTCDVCVESNELHGSIISMEPSGSDMQIVARGLRNAVFFDWSYVDGKMYATEMGRDNLGDNLPPEEVNIIEEGKHYGWPYCYGDRVRDETFRPQDDDFDCAETQSPHLTLPAHTAPLGLAFIPEEGWPEEYWYDLLVAEHGSWNSSKPVGYKIVRFPLDAQGNPEGQPVDFIAGWLRGSRALGRPVDLHAVPGGTLYITDDKAGVVYKLARISE